MLSRFTTFAFLLAYFSLGPHAAGAALTTPTKTIELADAYAGWQLVISTGDRDVTRESNYHCDNPSIARVDAIGYVTPVGNGSTMIHVNHSGGKLDVPVKVSGVGSGGRAVDFRTEVVPLLSKLGCNAGGCHGKASGQNGFKLSLFGFDVDFDYAAIDERVSRPAAVSFGSGPKPVSFEGDGQGAARRRQAAESRWMPSTR